jgi:hypothetical protein
MVASNLLSNASQALQAKGYDVGFAEAPVLGAFLDPKKPVRAAEQPNDPPVEMTFPVLLSEDVRSDGQYRQALSQVIHQTLESMSSSGELPEEKFLADPSITNSLHLIATRKQIDYLMVVIGHGAIVSGGKQFGQALGTALLSTVLSAGLVTVTRHNISFLNSYVGLINLTNAELAWCNSLCLLENPDAPDLYKGYWSRSLLYYLPVRGLSTALSGQTTGPPAAIPLQAIPVPADKAVVCLYRDMEDPLDIAHPIMFQGHQIASLNRDEFFLHTVDPGEIVYKIPPAPNLAMSLTLAHTQDSVTTLRVKSGNIYYLHIYHGTLLRVENATGRIQAAQCIQAP